MWARSAEHVSGHFRCLEFVSVFVCTAAAATLSHFWWLLRCRDMMHYLWQQRLHYLHLPLSLSFWAPHGCRFAPAGAHECTGTNTHAHLWTSLWPPLPQILPGTPTPLPLAWRGPRGLCVRVFVCVRACLSIVMRAPVGSIRSLWGHFGWSSQVQRLVWGLRLGFMVWVRIRFKLGWGLGI